MMYSCLMSVAVAAAASRTDATNEDAGENAGILPSNNTVAAGTSTSAPAASKGKAIDLTGEPKKKAPYLLLGAKEAPKENTNGKKNARGKKCNVQKEFTNQEKLAILDEIDRRVASQAAIIKKYGMSRQTVNN